MANFIEAYRAGLNIVERTKNNKREIDGVFEELNSQLFRVSDGKIQISIKPLHETISFKELENYSALYLSNASNALGINDKLAGWRLRAVKGYVAICAKNQKTPGSDTELAEWKQSRAGYPCEIILGSQTYVCEDKEALENALAEMLRDPIVGEKLFKLANLPVLETDPTLESGIVASQDTQPPA
ncbi:hypothetical protein [Methylomagnum ishizawai]|uniref:hypothetical protein n=1 Tax=Methylomagnum ishizawai TaxID=1760988 RepID=UPI001C330E60|nr:hypothetical protein [Methylomagnum ishizawai]BBL73049.1 hypothetical protein MishRS11D_01470 [Methylomagnum ishizawai]